VPLESLATFIIASALLGIAPGPDNIFVLSQSVLYGKKSGILITLGLHTGLIVHTTAVALGIATIFQTSIIAFTVLKIVGALYLAYLAWQAFHASTKTIKTSDSNRLSSGKLYRRGIIMNLSNPKISIFFLAFLPQFASPAYGPIAPQIFLLGAIFIGVGLTIFIAIALLAGVLGKWLRNSPKALVYLNRIAGTVFGVLALKLASSSAE